ncbi:hypothetical protein AMTRI_Chr12g268990 [Amborella trichopoda]
MADRLNFLPCHRSVKKRTNPEERSRFDPLTVDELEVIPLLESDEEIGKLAMKTLQSSAMVLAESVIPIATLLEAKSGVVDDDGEEDALYRGILEDMGLDYEVLIAVVLQAIEAEADIETQVPVSVAVDATQPKAMENL